MKSYLSLIKFSHTVFALPFALLGFFLATLETGKGFSWQLLVLVVLCMVFARSAAMAFNRYLDRDIDGKNPRTATREIPAGVISARAALFFVIANSLLFIATTWFINFLCFALSPVALLIILGYSYTKRFTYLCHFVLGLGLALAPVGAYLAVSGRFDLIPVLYAAAVLLWVSGFDIIYALQDEDFDKSLQLRSVPVKLGRKNALLLSSVLHIICALLIVTAGYLLMQQYPVFGWLHWLATIVFIAMLYYQHRLVKPNDLSRVNMAFATTNGVASVVFGALTILDMYI
ncbi:MAG TPA: UbiA-like polyprenyltransferase [Saprospiraceae bacterium]|nr:UbiA-like polyprenyltransferase [Saprospiraceae bacterium]HMP25014.1 UbiA-like polyprenyltransferase [Saprospiraceae bacterium]